MNRVSEASDVPRGLPAVARYTTRQVALAWGRSPAAVRRWVADGLIPAMRLPSGQLVFGADALPPTDAA